MPITASAGGKEFTFPDGTPKDQIASAIDEYFAANNPELLASAANATMQAAPPAAAPVSSINPFIEAGEQVAADLSAYEKAMVSLGRGASNVLSGIQELGLRAESVFQPEALAELEKLKARQEQEKQIFEGFKEESPIIGTVGEIAGEIGALAPLGLAQAGLAAGRGLAARTAIGAGIGATEGAVLTGGDLEAIQTGAGIGGAIEAASPLAGKLFRGIKGAASRAFGKNIPINDLVEEAVENGQRVIRPTEKGRQALTSVGIKFEDLNEAALDELAKLPQRVDPTQAARKALFDDLGIKTVRSRITQNPEDFAREQMLRRSTQTPQGAGLGEALATESAGFKDKLVDVANDLGEAEESGALINAALESRKKGLKRLERRAYSALDELSKGKSIRVPTKALAEVFDSRQLKRLKRQDKAAFDNLRDLAVEFGINKDPNLVGKFADEITPLSISNQEDYRQALNLLIKNDGSAGDAAAKQMIRTLDDQMDRTDAFLKTDEAIELLGQKGADSRAIIKQARKARAIARQVRDEFNPKKLAARFIDSKQGDLTSRVVENSEIAKSLLSKSTSLEALTKTTDLLKQSAKGKKALGALQAKTVLRILNDATSAQSAKLAGGVIDFSPTKFSKAIDNIGRDKLAAIFETNPAALADLRKLEEAAKLKTPFSDAVMRSNTFPDLWNKLREGVSGVVTTATKAGTAMTPLGGALDMISKGSASKKATKEAYESLKQATNVAPDVKETANLFRIDFARSYPALATQLGVFAAIDDEEE